MSWSIEERTVIVTGGNSGIGRATATALGHAGAHVVITARDPERGTTAAAQISAESGGRVDAMLLDLEDRGSIRSFAEQFANSKADLAVLVNNAGGIFGRRELTSDGVERTFATNHLGPFLLTHLLTPMLISCSPSRVVNVASSGHGYAREGIPFDDLTWEGRYSMRGAYGVSKLANILHAREYDRRHRPDGVSGYSMHPGLVRTSIGRDGDSLIASIAWRLTSWRQRSPAEGADTVTWLATADPDPEPHGGYFEDGAEARSTRHARDDHQAERLWRVSEALLGLSGPST
ncbi:MAG TPA: SDR family oxidoreductase [Acidimicrobiia bacterium]|nr:SDR family oxidoreductase [Acidimicrobiia bacterium]